MITIPVGFGSLRLPSLEIQQFIEGTDLIISLLNSPTPAKYLLRQSLEVIQLESGLTVPALEESYKVHEFLVTRSWI
jgi:hypothetical protein